MLDLSERMKKIISFCEPCDTIVDVGTDHGKIAISVANLNISNKVIAIDNKIGPLSACRINAEKYLNKDSAAFETSLSDGVSALDNREQYGIIITGMGYDNIVTILSSVDSLNFKYLILSSHSKASKLIDWIADKNLYIDSQDIIFESDKTYYIFKVKRKGA